jgi:hypothetical protein
MSSAGIVANAFVRKRAYATAEDGPVRSDAERGREHGHGGETGVFLQLAESEFQIIHESSHMHRQSPCQGMLFVSDWKISQRRMVCTR